MTTPLSDFAPAKKDPSRVYEESPGSLQRALAASKTTENRCAGSSQPATPDGRCPVCNQITARLTAHGLVRNHHMPAWLIERLAAEV